MLSLDSWRRVVLDRRRPLAAVCAGLAVLAALSSVRESTDGPRVQVAARDLPSGTVVDAGDVRTVRLTDALEPSHAAARSGDVVGRRVAGAMREGEVFTDRRVLASRPGDDRAAGTVLTTIRVEGPDGIGPARVGDLVDVVAVPPDDDSAARVVARGVEVLATRTGPDGDGPVALDVATTRASALALASAGLRSRMSVLVSTAPAAGR